MGQPITYDFDERLTMSQGVSSSKTVADIILNNIPGARHVYQAHKDNDRTGVDYWVEMSSGAHMAVDVKVRDEDFAESKGFDDLALETWSVVEQKKVGWTRDERKRCDYVLWLWKDTGRWCLIPFQWLCAVFSDKWQQWSSLYKVAQQHTPFGNGNGYHSECVFVPRREVWVEIYRRYAGNPEKPDW